jgi:prephenate dehydrogenase
MKAGMKPFGRVAVIGVGLIGGSFAMALRASGGCREVVGAGRDPGNMRRAVELGVIDSAAGDAAEAVRGADLVLVAAPVAQFPRIFQAIAPAIGADALVIDAGSTKQDVVAAARRHLGGAIARFVPSHPIAGAEKSGVTAAKADLLKDRRVVITPLEENASADVDRVAAAWEACGAHITRMGPEEHDAVLAAVSHLPHLLSYALVHEFAGRENSAQLFGLAAGGFRDFTRIASSHPEMWRDISVANRACLLVELDRYAEKLEAMRPLIERGDGTALEKLFTEARAARERWLAGEYR